MMQDRVFSLLGLAFRAKMLSSGAFAVEQAIKKGKARIVVVTVDTSEASVKGYQNMCDYYGVELYHYGTKDTMGKALGKEARSVVSVNDEGFAAKISKELKNHTTEQEMGGSRIHGENQ